MCRYPVGDGANRVITIKKAPENVKKLLKRHNQSHLLAFWGQLNADQRQNLLAQIEGLDFSKIDDWVANYIKRPIRPGAGLEN